MALPPGATCPATPSRPSSPCRNWKEGTRSLSSPADHRRQAMTQTNEIARPSQAETVLGMVAPATPQRPPAGGVGGRYISAIAGPAMVPTPSPPPGMSPRPSSAPVGSLRLGMGLGPLHAGADTASYAGAAAAEGGRGSTDGGGAQPAVQALPGSVSGPSSLTLQVPSSALVRPIAHVPSVDARGMPVYEFDSSGTALVPRSRAPVDMVSISERATSCLQEL